MTSMIFGLPLLALALLGHGFVWVALINWTHAVRMPKWLCDVLTVGMFFLSGALPAVYAAEFWGVQGNALSPAAWLSLPTPAWSYGGLCAALGAYALAMWCARRIGRGRAASAMRYDRRLAIEVFADPADRAVVTSTAELTVRLPGNEILELDVVQRGLRVENLPVQLSGLSILHVSDVHLSGKIDRRYYENLVRIINGQDCDLIALTGDLVDKPDCIDWLPTTLGKLRARHGVYFILGNHDQRQDHVRIRKTLADCGLIGVGGVWRELTVREHRLVVAGNERPWFRKLPELTPDSPRGCDNRPLKIVLTHSPDQFRWACDAGADLVLAGHTHAGQIQLPWIGPVFSPCVTGVRYAEGVFQRGSTLLHVTRGVSAKLPVRFRCRPEIVRLELCGVGETAESSGEEPARLAPRKRERPLAESR
jgi:predicted MPP superfamily phosphohydrolase